MGHVQRYADNRFSHLSYLLLGAPWELAIRAALWILVWTVRGLYAGCRWAWRRARRGRAMHE